MLPQAQTFADRVFRDAWVSKCQ